MKLVAILMLILAMFSCLQAKQWVGFDNNTTPEEPEIT